MSSRPDNPDWIKKTKKRVRTAFEKWNAVLGLGSWDFIFSWDPGHGAAKSADYHSEFAIDALWEYKKATITIWCASVHDLADTALEQAVLHELLHCMVCEMRDWRPGKTRRKHEERVVVQLCDAFWNTRRAGYDVGFKKGRRASPVKKKRASRKK